MRAYVGVTDWDRCRFLAPRGARRVNFWQPSGGRRFGAIPQGAPFLLKTHYPHGDRIVGPGVLSGWASLPMSRAWEFFDEPTAAAACWRCGTEFDVALPAPSSVPGDVFGEPRDWGNGEEFYRRAQADIPLALPDRQVDRPNSEFLTWHADTVFMAS